MKHKKTPGQNHFWNLYSASLALNRSLSTLSFAGLIMNTPEHSPEKNRAAL